MKKLLYHLLFAISLLGGQTLSDNIIKGSAGGEEIITENRLQRDRVEEQDEFYKREAIFNWILWSKSQERPSGTQQTAKLIDIAVEDNASDASLDNQSAKNTTIVRGYCVVTDDVHINKQPASLSLRCNTNIGAVEVFGNLLPINEAAALIFQPLNMDFNGYRYKIGNFTTTNEARTSYNIATYVNDRKVAEVGYSTTIVAADEMSKSTNEYLKQLQDSKKKQEVQYIAVDDGAGGTSMQPVQTTNTEKPDVIDYVAVGAVNILTHTIKTAAEIFRKDLPYLYEIVGGSRVYIDLEVENKGVKI